MIADPLPRLNEGVPPPVLTLLQTMVEKGYVESDAIRQIRRRKHNRGICRYP